MKYFLSFVIAFVIYSINSSGQSLKGRIWQSQDFTNNRIKPKTLVLKPDGTYYQLEYLFSSSMTLVGSSGFEEGTYTETNTSITLTQYYENTKFPPVTLEIEWLNNSEFNMFIGINKYHYAEQSSESDIFSLKYLVPYITKELNKKHTIDSCYKELVDQINITNGQRKDEALSNSKIIKKSSLIGTIWQMQMDENREERGRLNNIYFEPNGTLSEVYFSYANGVVIGTDGAKKETYREDADGSILRFFNSGKTKIPLDIVWKSEDELIIGRYYYARFNSSKDLFSANYLKDYTISLVEQAKTVYPTFLEVFAENSRRVALKRFECSNEDKELAPYLSMDFVDFGMVSVLPRNRFTTLMVSKDYHADQNSLYLAKHKLFSRTDKAFSEVNWEEKWEFKWVNSQEFIITKDSKSYHYVLQGKTLPKSYE